MCPAVESLPQAIVIGGSAGGLKAILRFVKAFRNPHPAVVLVMHQAPDQDVRLPEIIRSSLGSSLTYVSQVYDKVSLSQNCIYIAPPNYHVLVESEQTLSLSVSEKVSYCRPSIDVTFESAALVFQQKLLCILLSGTNSDGAQGLRFASHLGAKVWVQSPESADFPIMPEEALALVKEALVLSPECIEQTLKELIHA